MLIIVILAFLAIVLYFYSVVDLLRKNSQRPGKYFALYWFIGIPIIGPLIYLGFKDKIAFRYRQFDPEFKEGQSGNNFDRN